LGIKVLNKLQYIQWIQESKLRLISQSMNAVDEAEGMDITGEREKVSAVIQPQAQFRIVLWAC
jgi:hypothetical protein